MCSDKLQTHDGRLGSCPNQGEDKIASWPRGEMASRLTTNQEIPGSTPGVVIFFGCYHCFMKSTARSKGTTFFRIESAGELVYDVDNR